MKCFWVLSILVQVFFYTFLYRIVLLQIFPRKWICLHFYSSLFRKTELLVDFMEKHLDSILDVEFFSKSTFRYHKTEAAGPINFQPDFSV